jgi:hypothetical protein
MLEVVVHLVPAPELEELVVVEMEFNQEPDKMELLTQAAVEEQDKTLMEVAVPVSSSLLTQPLDA